MEVPEHEYAELSPAAGWLLAVRLRPPGGIRVVCEYTCGRPEWRRLCQQRGRQAVRDRPGAPGGLHDARAVALPEPRNRRCLYAAVTSAERAHPDAKRRTPLRGRGALTESRCPASPISFLTTRSLIAHGCPDRRDASP